jgi:hypothetical protein
MLHQNNAKKRFLCGDMSHTSNLLLMFEFNQREITVIEY